MKKICKHGGCQALTEGNTKYCSIHQEDIKEDLHNRYVREKTLKCREWSYLYRTKAWKHRREAQLKTNPFCSSCSSKGYKELAVVADHIEDHKGNEHSFYYGELQSLCFSCHSRKTARENNRSKR